MLLNSFPFLDQMDKLVQTMIFSRQIGTSRFSFNRVLGSSFLCSDTVCKLSCLLFFFKYTCSSLISQKLVSKPCSVVMKRN